MNCVLMPWLLHPLEMESRQPQVQTFTLYLCWAILSWRTLKCFLSNYSGFLTKQMEKPPSNIPAWMSYFLSKCLQTGGSDWFVHLPTHSSWKLSWAVTLQWVLGKSLPRVALQDKLVLAFLSFFCWTAFDLFLRTGAETHLFLIETYFAEFCDDDLSFYILEFAVWTLQLWTLFQLQQL